MSNEDFICIFKNIIATHTIEELQVMVDEGNKNKLPVIVALCIAAFIHDINAGVLTATNSILDRIMGKPTQQVIFSGGGLAGLPGDPGERRALAERLRKELDFGKLPSAGMHGGKERQEAARMDKEVGSE